MTPFIAKVEPIIEILEDLDEFDRPKKKLPNCPKCEEDELGVVHAGWVMCYRCGWELRSRMKESK
jgi:hypothetical protein